MKATAPLIGPPALRLRLVQSGSIPGASTMFGDCFAIASQRAALERWLRRISGSGYRTNLAAPMIGARFGAWFRDGAI